MTFPQENCHEKGAKILILGTYHLDNPGRDSVNVRVDDVLAEKRQREIAFVLDRLANFKPTKIAIEASYKAATGKIFIMTTWMENTSWPKRDRTNRLSTGAEARVTDSLPDRLSDVHEWPDRRGDRNQ